MGGVLLRSWLVLALSVLVGACTKPNPNFCDADEECEGEKSYCDVDGEFAKPNTCIAPPESCPLDRCGCEPGAGLTCDVDQLTVCNEDGTSSSTVTCGLGCSTAEPRCLTFEPSNGLGEALEMAAAEPDIVLPAGSTIDTTLGLVQDTNGGPIDLRSIVISQDGGTSIRVFLGRSFVVDSATIVGTHAFALVAPGKIALRGILDASAQGQTHGPGGQALPAVCVGGNGNLVIQNPLRSRGGGGAGNATPGGAGGGYDMLGADGGAMIPQFEPLVGGCGGGTFTDAGNVLRVGGGGGGAVQLVSLEEVSMTTSGLIHVGGGGGLSNAGGGSGGNVIVEAPRVVLSGASTGIAANGGAGGGCDMAGPDASPDRTRAAGPQCSLATAGSGGTGSVSPGAGQVACVPMFCGQPTTNAGGGGGAAGRASIATQTGAVEMSGDPVLNVELTLRTLTVN